MSIPGRKSPDRPTRRCFSLPPTPAAGIIMSWLAPNGNLSYVTCLFLPLYALADLPSQPLTLRDRS